ncbi:MAG: GNAT family N-acetyltransferase [Candidatus Poribacteria bacterium]|nr:GNAT family N-acetyltransferase [Candidatus Poribacteria bacterium]
MDLKFSALARFLTSPFVYADLLADIFRSCSEDMNVSDKTDIFLIRECLPEEAEALLTLWQAAGTSPSITDTITDVHRAIESLGSVLVAEAHQRIVGSLIATFDGWRGNMYRLAVHPDYRRRGIGRALVAEGERCLAKQGVKRITALVEEQYPWAIAFWSSVGYEIEPGILRFFRNP